MVVVCSNCGAPLDVHEGAAVTKCAYCGRTDGRKNLRTLHEQTPKEFVPPPRWRPPANVPAASTEEYAYKPTSQGTTGWVVLGVAISVLAVAIPLFFDLSGRAGRPTAATSAATTTASVQKVDPRILETATIDGTEEDLYRQLGGSKDPAHLTVDVAHDTWTSVEYYFHNDHVARVTFSRSRQATDDDVARIASALGIRLRLNHTWEWYGLEIELQPGLLCCNMHSYHGTPTSPGWKRQIAVAYSVLKEVVYGQKSPVGIDERREILGASRPLADLTRMDPSISIDDAPTGVPKLLPGVVVVQGSDGLEIHFRVDHPRVPHVRLRWPNTRGAKLQTIALESEDEPATGGGLAPYLDDLSRCLAKPFGAPTATDTDYLKKRKKYEFAIPGARVSLTEYDIRLASSSSAKSIPKEALATLVATLDTCR